MTEPTRDELMRRIERLERANRRWRRGSFVVAGLLAIGLVALIAGDYRRVMDARRQLELARQQVEHARQAVEAARAQRMFHDAHEAVKSFREPIRSLKSQPKKADDIPLNLNDVLWPRQFPEEHWEPPHDRISPLERP
jgi:type VI protein secretion system component VasK